MNMGRKAVGISYGFQQSCFDFATWRQICCSFSVPLVDILRMHFTSSHHRRCYEIADMLAAGGLLRFGILGLKALKENSCS